MAQQPNPPTKDLWQYDQTWQVLKIFNLYRFFLCATLLILNIYNFTSLLGKYNATLFAYTAAIYLIFSLFTVVTAIYKIPSYQSQVVIVIFADILFLTLLLNCSGSIASGLSMLFIPVIAAASLLIPGKVSFLFTAMASIAMLAEQTFTYLYQNYGSVNFIASGLSGITLFATAGVINILYWRLHASEALTKLQTNVLADLEELNALIIQKIHIGVIVVDQHQRIQMVNAAASNLLNLKPEHIGKSIDILPTDISKLILAKAHQSIAPAPIILLGEQQISAEFVHIGHTDKSKSSLIFLEDLSKQTKKVQEMKLISIGRITANIAHEIRNPLAAISHAAELLGESTTISSDNARLLHIVQDNAKRTNNIIENVLLLSKAKPSMPQKINLSTWMHKFVQQFVATDIKVKPIITLNISQKNLYVYMDETQLYQIITNLTENGLRYSVQQIQQPVLLFNAGSSNDHIYLDIIDSGTGVEENNVKYLFEPFFTTNPTGTGLGLYMARELCQANNAKLDYYPEAAGTADPTANKHGHFRIIFPHSEHI